MKEIEIDLLPLIKKLEVVLKKGLAKDFLAGSYRSIYKGKGLEFVGYREYSPTDDAILIDWKASLKANHTMIKVLEEERDLSVLFLLDVSDSMLFSSHKKLKCEYAAELVGTLCFAMHHVGDKVGILMFNDKVLNLIPPGRGRNHFYKIVKTLSDPTLYGGRYDLDYALRYIFELKFLQRDTIIFIVSDFIGLKPGWEYTLKLAGLKYDLTAIVVRDPVDMQMPNVGGEVHLGDPYTNQQLLISPLETKKAYETEAMNQIIRLKKELHKTSSNIMLLETNQDFTGEIFRFFKLRALKKA